MSMCWLSFKIEKEFIYVFLKNEVFYLNMYINVYLQSETENSTQQFEINESTKVSQNKTLDT